MLLKKHSIIAVFILTILASCSKDEIVDNSEGNPTNEVKTEFRIDSKQQFINFVVPPAEYQNFLNDKIDYKKYTQKVYKSLQDDFDFILFVTPETESPKGVPYVGINHPIQNEVKGIAKQIFNNSNSYDSNGKLKSVLYMPKMSSIENGPLLHEICHNWANFDFLETTVPHHWGYSSVGGNLGGFDKTSNVSGNTYKGTVTYKNPNSSNFGKERPFGTVANGGNGSPFSILELYLMGLAEANELKDIQVAVNPKPVPNEYGSFTADGFKTVTPAELVKKHGVREPSYANSQKEFKMLVVAVSNKEMTEEENALLDKIITSFTRKGEPDKNYLFNFWTGSMKRASVSSDKIKESLK
ncbi:hypothetical protein [uncultured Tenacibaculum sp.]|uniref:hypothetical protein n=1 Tax=uncultured Tenacibaculum sp. TaxID=174713 RepID=UPI002635C732|nr:hypothetical protein [uncultured Tenacibaculum sp.]